VDWRRPLWSSVILFRSRWYTLGVLIAMAGWGLHVGALSLAPISLGALSDHLGSDSAAAILFSPLAAVILLASLIALLVSARSLQIAPAVSVIAVTSVAANALTIAAGPIVFSEPFPDRALGVTARVLAFALP
jgi:hypothetical protein